MRIFDRYREVAPLGGEIHRVIENLRHVLNTKAGFYPIREDFGLSDLAAARDRNAALRRLVGEILANVHEYEPRLTVDSLGTLGRDADFWLRLELRGRIGGQPLRLLVRFNQVYCHFDVRKLHVE